MTSEKRLALLPDVPTMSEAGVPDVDRPQWFSLFGPANMPPALARRIRDDVVAVLAGPEILARIRDLASEPGGETRRSSPSASGATSRYGAIRRKSPASSPNDPRSYPITLDVPNLCK